ncbi:transcription regulator gal80 [Penicillium desertorum]|uniref:Transcription regulator gal80 n=1 Tax=Penicillium desertorum TaxID=1303715 RepID=A0A9W9WD68_9EURO|nr:transcription regulator gal80 [Penicillium desertorum]
MTSTILRVLPTQLVIASEDEKERNMNPIRVGIIGLSTGGGWAAMAHLPYLQKSTKYNITGVCNSSGEKGKEAIDQYGLKSAKAFDNIKSMCASQEIDLVVCAVAVFSHYELIKPVIEAGKDVYVEWPLCATAEQAEEIQQLAQNKGDRAIEGASGQVMLSIYVGHTFEPLTRLMGQPSQVSAQLMTTWPEVNIITPDNVILESGIEKTADDYVTLQGTLTSGVKYLYSMRGGDAFDEGEGLVWDIIGDKGQIRLTGSSIMLNLGAPDYKIRVKDYKSGRIEAAKLHDSLDLPLAAQNIGSLYEKFADGKVVPTFEDAVRRHHFLDAMFLSASKGGHSREGYRPLNWDITTK